MSVPERRGTVKVRLEGPLHVWQLALHAGVPVILDRVVCASLEHLSDFCPLVVDDAVHQEQDPLFLLVPVDLLDARVEVVVPALAALLANSAVQVLRDEGPLLWSVGHNQLEDSPVFLRRPGSLDVEWLTLATHSLLWE